MPQAPPESPFPTFQGTPAAVGRAYGLALRSTLAVNTRSYVEAAIRAGVVDAQAMRHQSMPWFETVPPHFRDEMEGVARGAGVPLHELVEALYGTAYAVQGCTSVVSSVDGHAWIAHNNDWFDFGSHRWTGAVVRHIDGRIPHLTFGLQGDVCAVVGVNREQLWMNMNGFPSQDTRRQDRPVIPYVFVIREALETCATIDEVETLLRAIDRDAGMAIYVVDGKNEDAALFECGLSTVARRDPVDSKTLVSSSRDPSVRDVDHRTSGPLHATIFGSNSRDRIDRLHALLAATSMSDLPSDLVSILADPIVEDRDGTIYSNVACPGRREIWFSHGGLPAASRGPWRRIPWPWA